MKCIVCNDREIQVKKVSQCQRCYYRLKWHTDGSKVKQRENQKNNKLKQQFGITVNDYRIIFDSQQGKCPICSQDLIPYWDGPSSRNAAVIDHDHNTGIVRGLVCHQCNRNRIGMNTLETAQRIVEYLGKGGYRSGEIFIPWREGPYTCICVVCGATVQSSRAHTKTCPGECRKQYQKEIIKMCNRRRRGA